MALLLDYSDSNDADGVETARFNREIYPAWQEANRAEGLLAGAWVTQGDSMQIVPSGSDLAIAEIEGPGDYDGVVYCIEHGLLPDCPLATVTNFSTITRARAKVLIDANFTCLPEAYMNENMNMTPDRMDLTARNLGWPTSQPVAGVYPVGGNPVPSYAQWADWPLCDYLLEYII